MHFKLIDILIQHYQKLTLGIYQVARVVLDCDVDHELESSLIVSYVAQVQVKHRPNNRARDTIFFDRDRMTYQIE